MDEINLAVMSLSNYSTDVEKVRNVLRAARNLAHGHRYGGLGCLWREAQEAIEAFERIVSPQQPTLFEGQEPSERET